VAATATSAVCSNDEAKFGDSATCAAATPTADVCENAEADFGAGCVVVCPPGQVDAGSGCATPAADTCPTGICIAACPTGFEPSGDACVLPADCSYATTVCAAGAACPGGTLVSAACANRSRFNENPCACTALQQLAALSPSVPTTAPWNDLASGAYCQTGSDLGVACATVDGVQVPTAVAGGSSGLAGALPPSLRELGPSLEYLTLPSNAITSVPTEIGALTGLTALGLNVNAITSVPTEIGALTSLRVLNLGYNAITSVPTELAALTSLETLYLDGNQLTGVPTEFRTWGPPGTCQLANNPRDAGQGFSCANVGGGTTCCTADTCGDTATCFQG